MPDLKQGQKKVSFVEAMKLKKTLSFDFEIIGDTEQVQSDKSTLMVAIVRLMEPIEQVLGSQKGVDGDDIIAYDVDIVRIREDAYKEEGFELIIDEKTGEVIAGTYSGSKLVLDVAKSTGDVWLVKEKFSVVGRTMAQQNMAQRQLDVKAKLKALRKPTDGMQSNGVDGQG